MGEVVCDTMDNEALLRYNAHPERICVVYHGVLVHVGGTGGIYYDIQGVIDWLDGHFGYDPSQPSPAQALAAAGGGGGGAAAKGEGEEEAECAS